MNLEATFSTGAPPPPPCPCNPQRTVGRGENYPHLLSYLCFGTKATISLARCATSFVALVYTTCAYAALLRRSQPPLGYSGMCLSRPALHIKCHPRPRSGFGRSERVPKCRRWSHFGNFPLILCTFCQTLENLQDWNEIPGSGLCAAVPCNHST